MPEEGGDFGPIFDQSLAPVVQAIGQLSRDNLKLVASLVKQMANGEGTDIPLDQAQRLRAPSEGIPHWVAKMKSERYSERTIGMYKYLVGGHLKRDPNPTKLGIQSYLAKRLEGGTSPAAVENERKALRSLFSFLCQEGLWPADPTAGIKHVRVSYGNRRCPTIKDVERVLEVGCLRSQDTDKIRTMIVLLATTGLRLTEAASLRKDSIDLEAKELRINGKGDKYRVVPLLPATADALKGYMERHPGDSPFVFPGSTRTGYAEIYNIEKTLRRACLRAGVEPFTPHGLRHFYATEMLRKGAKLEVVGRILGHSSIGITADIYRYVAMAEVREENNRYAPLNEERLLKEMYKR